MFLSGLWQVDGAGVSKLITDNVVGGCMRATAAAVVSSLSLLVFPTSPAGWAADGRPPEHLEDQGLQGPGELEAATRAVRAVLGDVDVDDDGRRDLELVATVHGNEYWVIGDLDPASVCQPTLFDEITFAGCDVVRFTRHAGRDGGERYDVEVVAGGDPLGEQGPGAGAAVSTIPEEFASARVTVGSDGTEGCTLATDPDCRPLDVNGVTYPNAYERLSALFDSPRSPDLVVLQAHGGPDAPKGGHGHLSVLQSRSTFLVAGRGARRGPFPPDEELALGMQHTDIAPTVAAAIGVDPYGNGARRLGGQEDPSAVLLRQDGRVLHDLLAPTFNTFVVVFDGLEPELVTPELAPTIWSLMHGEEANATTYTNAFASMVTETNANHVGVTTGLPGQTHGLVSNAFYDRSARAVRAMDRPALVLADTFFDAIETQKPWLRTAAVLGKEKLRELFDCTRDPADPAGPCGPSDDNPEGRRVRHVRPDFLLGAASDPRDVLADPHGNAPAEPASGSAITLDRAVMDQAIRLQRTEDPDVTLVNLAQIDGVQHLFGAKSPQALAAVRDADAQLARLVDSLKESGKWAHSILLLTADHSFLELDGTGDAVDAGHTRLGNPATGHVTGSRVILSERFTHPGIEAFVAHGGSASIYLRDAGDRELAAQLAGEAREMTDNLGRPAVAGAFCRLASPACPSIPADYGLDTARIGEVLLVTDDQHVFLRHRAGDSAALTGHHGGPTAAPVPLVVATGGPYVRTGKVDRPVSIRDIAPTVAWIHEISGRTGQPFPGEPRWSRPLHEAFSKHPLMAHRDGDIGEQLAKRVLLVIFDANNSADVHCLLSQYDGRDAVAELCGETSREFHPSRYPVPALQWLRERGTLARFGSIASFPTVTFPNHVVVGSGAHPAHHGVPGNRFYQRQQQRLERPIEPADPQNPVFLWSESLHRGGFETLHEATHRTLGDWMGPTNTDVGHADGAFTAAVNEPTTHGADYATLQPPDRTTGEPLTAAHVGRADELAADTTRECAQAHEAYFEQSLIDHTGQAQARSLFDDPGHPTPTVTMLNFALVDGAAHVFGPHTRCALAAYRDSSQRLGRVLDAMRRAGVLGETLVVVTGDHGQENQRQLADGGGFAEAFHRALAGHRLAYVLADNLLYLRTARLDHELTDLGGEVDATFTVTDDDTSEPVADATVTVSDAVTGHVLAEGRTPPDEGAPRRFALPLPRRASAAGNTAQDDVLGQRRAGDLPTVANPANRPSSGQIRLRFPLRDGVVATATHPDLSDRTIRIGPDAADGDRASDSSTARAPTPPAGADRGPLPRTGGRAPLAGLGLLSLCAALLRRR
ncbi:MAG: alkaline phosphatase family protein [Actinobacteria bacterium]|nr:alkaline phosphatase family protein [Actinomycetota bacterium]